MTRLPLCLGACLQATVLLSPVLRAADEPPREWIDPDTGHRIIRLSNEPGSSTLYFHDNSYSPQGDKLIFNSPGGIVLLDITQLGKAPPQPAVAVPGGRGSYFARRTNEIYFVRGGGGGRGGPPPTAQSQRDGSTPPPATTPASPIATCSNRSPPRSS